MIRDYSITGKTRYWTGIGSRDVPSHIARLQKRVAEVITRRFDYTLLSGGAAGSDTNFFEGVCKVDHTRFKILLPWRSFRNEIYRGYNCYVPNDEEFKVAREFFVESDIIHWFNRMNNTSQKFHIRNYYQITSSGLFQLPPYQTELVVYYAPEEGRIVTGGTRTAVETARYFGIPTYNLGIVKQRDKLLQIIGESL